MNSEIGEIIGQLVVKRSTLHAFILVEKSD